GEALTTAAAPHECPGGSVPRLPGAECKNGAGVGVTSEPFILPCRRSAGGPFLQKGQEGGRLAPARPGKSRRSAGPHQGVLTVDVPGRDGRLLPGVSPRSPRGCYTPVS